MKACRSFEGAGRRPALQALAKWGRWSLLCGVLSAAAQGTDPPNPAVPAVWPGPLTDVPGDVQRGKALVQSRQTQCLLCHAVPGLPGRHGDLGPVLQGLGHQRTAVLRQRLMDGSVIQPDSVMPAYYRTAGLQRVMPQALGKPILQAQELEDVLAFLISLP